MEKQYLPIYIFDICLLDGTIIGECNLRVGYNDLSSIVGNIGYGIHESYRGHHYASKACRLLFILAKKHQMDYVIISCEPENAASIKTIESLDGQFLGIEKVPNDCDAYMKGVRYLKRYCVHL